MKAIQEKKKNPTRFHVLSIFKTLENGNKSVVTKMSVLLGLGARRMDYKNVLRIGAPGRLSR